MGSAEWGYVVLAGSGLPLLVYLAFFLLRQEVALKPGAILVLGEIFLCTWTALEMAGLVSLAVYWILPALCAALFALLLLVGRKMRLMHASESAVRAEIDEACRRLFIQKEEPMRGQIRLTAKGASASVRLYPQGRSFVTILLPRVSGSPKLSLFVAFIDKRYPGPIPRIRVTLDRR